MPEEEKINDTNLDASIKKIDSFVLNVPICKNTPDNKTLDTEPELATTSTSDTVSTSSTEITSSDSSTPLTFQVIVKYRESQQNEGFQTSEYRQRIISKNKHLKPQFELIKKHSLLNPSLGSITEEDNTSFELESRNIFLADDKIVVNRALEVLGRLSLLNNVELTNDIKKMKLDKTVTIVNGQEKEFLEETILSLEDIQDINDIQNIQNIQNIQDIQNIQNIQNIQDIQNIQNIQDIQNIQNIQGYQDISTKKPLDSPSPIPLVDVPLQCIPEERASLSEIDLFLHSINLVQLTILTDLLNLKNLPFSIIYNCRNQRTKQRILKASQGKNLDLVLLYENRNHSVKNLPCENFKMAFANRLERGRLNTMS